MEEVMRVLNTQTSSCGYPVYASMDVRDAGWKVGVVDVNLFPAGFNILSPRDKERGASRMREFFAAKLLIPGPWRITVVPEAHTNNAGYLENLAGILELLKKADCEPRLLWPGPPIPKPWVLKTRSGYELEYLPAETALEGAQALLLNHDLSGGIPAAIRDVKLPTFPSPKLGWYRRRKSSHFEIADALLQKIARTVDFFDPWYFSTQSIKLSSVSFESESDLDKVASSVSDLLAKIGADYRERGITQTPHVFVKNDAGTYGVGIMSVKDASEVRNASRRLRSKMRTGKESVPISDLILQEAIPSMIGYEATPGNPESKITAEPTLYLVNGIPIGGFLRIQENLGSTSEFENLNQPGGKLEPLDCSEAATGKATRPFARPRGLSACQQIEMGQIYYFLARLHATAAGLEECPG